MSTVYELHSNIWVTEVELGDYKVRGVLICNEQHAVIWDTLSHPHDMHSFLPLIGDRQLTIIYSHADWDHIWGTAALPHHSAQIIGHNLCQERFRTDVPFTLQEKREQEPKQWEAVELVGPTLTFQQELSIALGKSSITLHHLPGHTVDSIVAFLPEQGLLLMGDTVETPFPVIPEKCPLDQWIKELKRWESDPRVHTVVPSHGEIGGRETLQQNINYLQNLQAGRNCTLPAGLTDFYIETHRENMRVCK